MSYPRAQLQTQSAEPSCQISFCGVQQVEVRKHQKDGGSSDGDAPAVVRACIMRVPPGYDRIEVSQLSDSIWGSDGWDT